MSMPPRRIKPVSGGRHPHLGIDVLARRNPFPGGRPLTRGALVVTRVAAGEVASTEEVPARQAEAALAQALAYAAGQEPEAGPVGAAGVDDGAGADFVAADDAAKSADSGAATDAEGEAGAQGPERLVILGYDLPTREQIAQIATAWDLHPLLVEDLMSAGQRPKLERYDDVLFVVTRSATYLDAKEEVAFSELHVLARGNVVIVLCQSREEGIPGNGQQIVRNRELLRLGAEAVVYALLDTVVDGYFPVLRGLDVDKEQIERQVFSGDAAVAERIYRLSQEVIDLQHAVTPLGSVLAALRAGFGKYGTGDELRAHLQDVSDHI